MTLEDFFTLTEMKDGLTALSRVQELITVMQKEKDCAVKNVADATRQWTAVASTIAATENKDCLDLFIHLDGLWFIDRWLKDAQKFCTDTNESFIEESITALLQALEKLHIDNERSVSSGIWITIKNLLSHKSAMVQDRARLLFDSWKHGGDEEKVNSEVDSVGVLHDNDSSKLVLEDSRPSASGFSTSDGIVKGDTHSMEPGKEPVLPSISSDLQSESGDEVKIHTHKNQLSIGKISDSANEITTEPLASSIVSNPVQERPSVMEDSTLQSVGGMTPSEPSFLVPKKDTVEGQSDFPVVNELPKNEKQADKVENSVPSPKDPGIVPSDPEASSSQEFMKQTALQNFESNENDTIQKLSPTDRAMEPASDLRSMVKESKFIDHANAAEDGERCSNALQDSSGNGSISGKPEDLKNSRMDDMGTVDEDEESASDEDKESASDEDIDFRNAYEFTKPVMDTKISGPIDRRRSDIELDYGVDALEFARRVAKAAEREVGDFKGQFSCSSSEKISEGGPKQPGSPDSINEKQDVPAEVPPKDKATAEAYCEGGLQVRNVAKLDTRPENCTHDMDFSQVTEAAQEMEVNLEKSPCGFDLNEEVCSDEMERPVNPVSTPIPVISASRPVTAPGLPVAPLQFEGALGWKGSAATSAFRPASPRRNSDSDKNYSVGGTSDGSSKQRQDFLDIDLNVAEGGDDLGKQIPALSGLPSGESSVEVSPKRSGRFTLDLNRCEDDGDVLPSNLKGEGQQLFNRNGHRSPSPASSSSSMQPFMRNIDLNDRPSFLDSLDQGSGKSSQAVNYVVPKSDASVISIMGTKVEINRKDFVPQVLSLPNGKTIDPAIDATTTRTGGLLGFAPTGSFTHSPVFGYSGLTSGPTMSFSSTMYGTGGAIATVVPQIVPSASAVTPFSQPPFIMSMTNAQPGLNGAGPSRPSLDLNSGFVVEGGNRDSVLRPVFISGQGRPLEEHLRTNSQPPSSSSIGGKRKEPDSGWEAYQFNYKQQQSPWR
ncbi:IIS transcription factor [Parasponia andersonii]|uniref:IIS transcription factor n=1 Tax=Parasponia andersonii TaxID=3476 RepID=A0A2P5DJC5_PARAD|nr:IIS transcription factor [Parasponia andersonii]